MAGQRYTLTFDAKMEIGQAKQSIQQFQSLLDGLKLPQSMSKGIQKNIDDLTRSLQTFEAQASKKISSKSDVTQLERNAEKINQLFTTIKLQFRDLGTLSGKQLDKLFPETIVTNIRKASQAMTAYLQAVKQSEKGVKSNIQQTKKLEAEQAAEKKRVDELTESLKKANAERSKASEKVLKRTKTDDLEEAEKKLDELIRKREEYLSRAKEGKDSQGRSHTYSDTAVAKAQRELEALQALKKQYIENNQAVEKNEAALRDAQDAYESTSGKIVKLKQTLEELKKQAGTEQQQALENLFKELSKIDGVNLDGVEHTFENAKKAIEGLSQAARENLSSALSRVSGEAQKVDSSFEETGKKFEDLRKQFEEFDTRARDVNAIKTRIAYFFGINNAIQLVRRALRSAFNAIKELDQVMTETAVVTDFTISDMWSQLPEYTKRANELGVATVEAYKAATLYYQQGLKTNEVVAISNETLKMARIAGLDAAEATDRMTNALRGFNMALNETSAQRVDDVYSKLAAITASDVDEISTAMTKVASLANNANMKFENTAAFLAQIIETTRESAETAGTALKTVIARFSEVKSLYSEDELRGTDDEGQEIDVNKISKALRTAGIDLNKYFLGEVGLDEIFMELASKWDTLTNVQQRYIATQAAGSRQQSRFIALMSDYARTQELTQAAFNAQGAAAKQFEKTQDSLQSKLARLKNAWNEFTMGISNSTLVKAGVDILTALLKVVNALTSGFGLLTGNVGGFINALAKISLSAGLLGFGKVAAGGIFGGKMGMATALAGKDGAEALMGESGLKMLGRGFISPFQRIFGKKEGKGPGIVSGIKSLIKKRNIAGTAVKTGTEAAAEVTEVAAEAASAAVTKAGKDVAESASEVAVELSESSVKAATEGATEALSEVTSEAVVEAAADTTEAAAKVATEAAGKAVTEEALDGTVEGIVKSSFKETTQTLGELGEEASKITTDIVKDATDVTTEIAENTIKGTADIATDTIDDVAKIGENAVEETTKLTNQAASASAASLWQVMAIVAVVAAAAYGVYSLYRKVSGKAAYESAKKSVEASEKALDAAKKERDAIEADLELIKEKNALLDETLKRQERLAILAEEEEAINRVLKENPSYAQYFEIGFDETIGETVISIKADLDELIKEQNDGIQELSENNYLAQAILANAEINSKKYDYMLNQGYIAAGGGNANWLGDSKFLSEQAQLKEQRAFYAKAAVLGEVQDRIEGNIFDIKNKESTNQIADALATALSKSINYNQLEQDKKALKGQYFWKTKGQINEEYQAIFHSNGEGLTLDQKKDQLATYHASQNYYSGLFDDSNFVKEFNKLDSGQQNIFAGLLNGGEGITRSWFDEHFANDQSTEGILKEFLEIFGGKQEDGTITGFYGTLSDELRAQLYEAIRTIANMNEQYETKIKDYFTDNFSGQVLATANDIFRESGLDILQQSNLYKQLFDYGGKGLREEQIKGFGNLYNDVVKNANQDIKDSVINILNSIDITDNDSINHSMAALESLGYNFDSLGKTSKELGKDFKQLGNATTKVDIDALKEKVTSNVGSQKELKGRASTDRKFSKEQYEEIIKLDKGMKDYFSFTAIEGGEYAFLGDDLDSIIKLLQNQLDEQLKENKESLQKDIDTAETFQEFSKTSEDLIGKSLEEVLQTAIVNLQESPEYIKDWDTFADNGKWFDYLQAAMGFYPPDNYNDTGYTDFLEQLKILMPGIENAKTASSFITQFSNLLGKVNNYQNNIDELATIDSDYLQAKYNLASTKEVLTATELKPEEKDKVISTKYWADEEALRSYDAVYDKLKGIKTLSGDVQKIAQGTSLIYADQARKMDGLNEKIQENKEGLESNDIVAIKQTAKALSDNYGIQISDEFVQKHKEQLIEMEADEESYLEVLSAVYDEYWKQHADKWNLADEESKNYLDSLKTEIADIPDIDIYSNINTEGFFEQVKNMFDSVEDFNNWLLTQGWALNWAAYGPEGATLEKILGGELHIVRSKGSGTGSYSGKSSGGGGGGGDSSWKNEQDRLYNLLQDIAEEQRKQTKLQEDYDRIISDPTATSQDIIKNITDQLNSYKQLYGYQAARYSERERDMEEYQKENSEYGQYVWYNKNDKTVEYDWAAINALEKTDKEKYDKIVEIKGHLEELESDMDEADDSMREIQAQVRELQNVLRDSYIDFESRVRDALIASQQQVIDNYSELNSTLSQTASDILQSLQDEITLQRQIRDNTKTEDDINQKEARLAYLRRDTTGKNQQEILKLEKELDENRQSYEDTLVDQAIERLQEENNKTVEQREHQIEIMQAQLDYQQKNGEFNEEVKRIINEGIDENGRPVQNSELTTLLKNAEGWNAMSAKEREVWDEQLNNETAQVRAYLSEQIQTSLNNTQDAINTINKILSDAIPGKLDAIVSAINGKTFDIPEYQPSVNYTIINSGGGYDLTPKGPPEETGTPNGTPNGQIKGIKYILSYEAPDKNSQYYYDSLKEKYGLNSEYSSRKSAEEALNRAINDAVYMRASNAELTMLYRFQTKAVAYASGGLNTKTGPAWLDGTLSHPEYVLNADQTQAFLKLANVLPQLLSSSSSISNTKVAGDIYLDLTMNVDEIGSNYDVDKIAERVKEIVYDSSTYRNVNVINFTR